MKKIIVIITLLFIFTIKINAEFPDEIKNITIGDYFRDEDSGWGANIKAGIGSDGDSYDLICSNYRKSTPNSSLTCTRSSWDIPMAAAIASILNSIDPDIGLDHVFASVLMSEFQEDNGVSDVTLGNSVCTACDSYDSQWRANAQAIYNEVEKTINNIDVDIGEITYTEDEEAFYLTIPITSTYEYGTYIWLSHLYDLLEDGRYKIYKADMNENDTVTVEVSTEYWVEVAENYDCGDGYQSVTPWYTEEIKAAEDFDTKTITLSKPTYDVDIYHLTYAGVDQGNYDGNDDYYVEESSLLGSYEAGSTVTVPTGEEKEYIGYHLAYIGTNLGGTITWKTVTPGETFTMPDRDCRLEYVYSLNTYKVEYDANGGEGAPETQYFIYNSEDPISTQTPTKTGYEFLYWTTPWRDEPFYPGDLIPLGWGDFKLVAQWTPNKVYITYNVNGGILTSTRYSTNDYGHIKDKNSNTEGQLYFHQISYGKSDDPYNASTFGLTRPGYAFVGWKVRSTGQILDQDTSYASTVYADYRDGNKTTANSETVWCYLDAQWQQIKYNVYITHWKYVGDGSGDNGGVNNCKSQETEKLGDYTVGSIVTVPYDKENNYNNYYLGYIGTALDDTYYMLSEGDTITMPERTLWLDYVYYPIFDITYHGNGGYDGTGHSKINDIAYYEKYYNIKNGDIFYKRDYVFNGWTTNPDGETDDGYNWTGWSGKWVYLNREYGISNGKLNLYARWKDRCIAEFEDDIKARIELYNSLETKRKNLLNFELHTAEEACEYYEPDYNPRTSCLETDQVDDSIEDDFDSENLSDFNDVIVNNTKISYCLTDFELELKLGINFNNPVKAGRLVLESNKDEDAIISTLTKTCYIHKDDIDNYKSNGEINESLFDDLYSDNIEGIYLDGKKLEVNINDPDITSYLDGEFYNVTATINAQYKFNEVSVYKLSGKECVSPNNECSKIGYGVLSKFIDAKNSNKGSFDFQIKKGPNSVFNFKNNQKISCTYTVEPEIIKYNNNDDGKIDLEFRTIDTNNPFNRTPKSNWNDGSNKGDSSNSIINDYILNATNSYGIKLGETKRQTPKYKITLTTDTIKAIRNYNKNKAYDNYEVCVDNGTNNCESNNAFINKYLKEGIITK